MEYKNTTYNINDNNAVLLGEEIIPLDGMKFEPRTGFIEFIEEKMENIQKSGKTHFIDKILNKFGRKTHIFHDLEQTDNGLFLIFYVFSIKSNIPVRDILKEIRSPVQCFNLREMEE